ncbi:extracellular solute-binding protein [Paenibacillus cisolokensis]
MKAIKKPFLLICLMLFVIMAACSGNTEKPQDQGNAGGDAQAAEQTGSNGEETKPEAEPEQSDEKIFDLNGETVKIGLWWDGADPRETKAEERTPAAEMMVKKIEEVEKKYNAKIEFVKFADYENYVEHFTTTSLAGEPFADVVVLELFWAFPTLAEKGLIEPIDQWLDMSDPKYNEWMRTGGSYKGKQYGHYDGSPSPYGFYYNKTLVEKLGLEDPYELQQKGEWTWDVFRDYVKRATKDTDGDGKTDIYGIAGANGGVKWLAEQFIYVNNGAVDKDENGEIKFSLDSPPAIEALQFVSDLYNVDKSIKPNVEDQTKEFVSGNGVFYAGFSWELSGLIEGLAGQEIGYVFLPKGPNADDYKSYTPFGNMYFAAKYSKNAEAAMHIYDEINLYGEGRKLTEESWAMSWPSKESLDTRKQMYDKIGYISYYAVPDGEKLFESVVKDITDGKVTPATAVDKVKQQFEANIGKLLSDSK